MTDERPGILLTGATGFVGGEVLARLLERDEQTVFALVRGTEREAAPRLRRVITNLLGPAASAARAVTVAGDVTRPSLGLTASARKWLADRVELIIHCAASVSFTLGLAESRAINVEGTRRILDLAEECARGGDGLHSFVHVSTAYVAGTHHGSFCEQDLDVGQGFRNAYERSKFEGETLVRDRAAALPVQVVRPSIVVGDSRTGYTPSFNVLYPPLRDFSEGTYPAIPARRPSPVDVVPVDYVADGIVSLSGQPGTTYHLTAGEQASTVGEMLDLATERLGRPAPRVLSPALYRRVIHPLLIGTARGARRRALRRSEALFPYFSMHTHYDNAGARDQLRARGATVPRLDAYFGRLMDFAVVAGWGRCVPARHETLADAGLRDHLAPNPLAHSTSR